MTTPTTFEPPRIERVHTGAGVLVRLGEELDRIGIQRALLLTGKTLSQGQLIARVRDAGGGRIASEFAGVGAHNPTSSVEAATSAFRHVACDGVVAFGGGSVVDCAKAIAWALRPSGAGAAIPLVDLATTLSGSEFACSFGQTDDATKLKGGWRDPSLYARAVFLDPELSEETPAWLWFATGFRAIDHAVESVLADNAHPYVDALALTALASLCALPSDLVQSHHSADQPRVRRGDEAELRARCFLAAWMAHAGSYHINWGLSHQMGRQLGPAFGVPHGYTSAIFLPAAVELGSSSKRGQLQRLGQAVKLRRGESFPDRLRDLARQMRLPTTLREVGIADREAVEDLFAGNDMAQQVIELVW